MNLIIPVNGPTPRKYQPQPPADARPKWQKWIDMGKRKDRVIVEQLEDAGFEFEEFLSEEEYNSRYAHSHNHLPSDK